MTVFDEPNRGWSKEALLHHITLQDVALERARSEEPRVVRQTEKVFVKRSPQKYPDHKKVLHRTSPAAVIGLLLATTELLSKWGVTADLIKPILRSAGDMPFVWLAVLIVGGMFLVNWVLVRLD